MIHKLPVVVLYPHARCNCRCVMCDIWKQTDSREMSAAELDRYLEDFVSLGIEWVVFSGGEPLMHSDLFRFCERLRSHRIRTTILTTGLLLERHAERIAGTVDDVIVSLDGPRDLHDAIRRVPGGFDMLARGVEALHRRDPNYSIAARSTVQQANFRCLRATARVASQLRLQSISFLAADVTSTAFNRAEPWSADRQSDIALSESDLPILDRELNGLLDDWRGTTFLADTAEKLRRIALHFQAHLGLAEPIAPRCNAPWVSAVVETDGTVRPCFFHTTIGNAFERGLAAVIKSSEATAFRASLDIETNPICRRCVCSLNWK